MVTKLCLVAAIVLVAGVVYANAAPANTNGWTVEHYYTNETWHAFADIGTKGAGPDDVYAVRQSVEDADGHTVGTANGYGVNLHPPYVFFHWTAVLPGGTLTAESAVDVGRKTSLYPIEGGTGRYIGAHGTVTLTDAGKRGTLATVRYQK